MSRLSRHMFTRVASGRHRGLLGQFRGLYAPAVDTTAPVINTSTYSAPDLTLDITEDSGAVTVVWATADPGEDPTYTIGGGWSGTTYDTGSYAATNGSTAEAIDISNTPGGSRELTIYAYDAAGNLSLVDREAITVPITYAEASATTGSPTLHEDVDGDGLWDAYEFTSDGSITLTDGVIGRRLWQGGGGSGGVGNNVRGGGGGGGGWTEVDDTEVSVSSGTYSVTVGLGGAGVTSLNTGNNGGDTVAFGTTAPGGGGGGHTNVSGLDGGNGGGGGGSTTFPMSPGSGSPGFNGGSGSTSRSGGGGGGSTSNGESATTGVCGGGGTGVDSDILGTTQNFGAGGGGSSINGSSNIVGAAGGASATAGVNNGGSSAATANRGGGSGGCSDATSGSGGSGVFIIRIRRAA
jgi:hypothetical protein